MFTSLRPHRVLLASGQRRSFALGPSFQSHWLFSRKQRTGDHCLAIACGSNFDNDSTSWKSSSPSPPSFSSLVRPAVQQSYDQFPSLANRQDQCRALSNDFSPPRFKDLQSPMPKPPTYNQMIVEPPIRSRPFRAGRSNKSQPHRRRPTRKRIPIASRSSDSNNTQQYAYMDEEFGTSPVQAFHAAQTIDIAAVVSKVFAQSGARKMMERLSVVIQLPSEQDKRRLQQQQQQQQHYPYGNSNKPARFVVVFRFGAVVFFNVAPREAADLLHKIKQHSTEPVLSGIERKENFCVHIQPDHELEGSDQVVTGEYCVVQELNMKSVDVISNIMAQSVALDAYNDTVDELLANFSYINGTVKGRGSLTAIQRDSLFRTVAQNNSIFIEMVSKLGIKDRSDTAWNLSQYEDIHAGMQEEFEINLRFEHIEFKLDLIQQNAKFFLEVLQSQKSNSLEWIIIILILFECVLMCMEMSGVGGTFFETIGGTVGKLTGSTTAASSAASVAEPATTESAVAATSNMTTSS